MLRRSEIETPFGASQRHALADEIRFFDIVKIHPLGRGPATREVRTWLMLHRYPSLANRQRR